MTIGRAPHCSAGPMAKSDRDVALEIAGKWEREAYDLEQMSARNGSYTELERRMLKLRATVKRTDAQELKLEMQRVRRG